MLQFGHIAQLKINFGQSNIIPLVYGDWSAIISSDVHLRWKSTRRLLWKIINPCKWTIVHPFWNGCTSIQSHTQRTRRHKSLTPNDELAIADLIVEGANRILMLSDCKPQKKSGPVEPHSFRRNINSNFNEEHRHGTGSGRIIPTNVEDPLARLFGGSHPRRPKSARGISGFGASQFGRSPGVRNSTWPEQSQKEEQTSAAK